MSQDTKGQNLIVFNGQGQKGRGGNLTFDIPAGKDGEGAHIQCFVLGGHRFNRPKAEQMGPVQSLVSTQKNWCYGSRRSTALGIHWGVSDTVSKG